MIVSVPTPAQARPERHDVPTVAAVAIREIAMIGTAVLSVAVGLALAASGAAAQGTGTAAKTVVLVHGAFADGSSWARVIPRLTAKGLRVVAVQNPLSSLAADVDAATRAIEQAEGPVVLVGHSWGGVVITEAGANQKVRSLVYVAAFAPDAGESVASLTKPFGERSYAKDVRRDAGGYLTLTADGVKNFFAQDLPAAEQEIVAVTQGPFHESTGPTPVARAAWKDRPAWSVIPAEDRIIPPPLHEKMAETIGATVTRVPGASHVVMLSQPQTVADVILEAAKGR